MKRLPTLLVAALLVTSVVGVAPVTAADSVQPDETYEPCEFPVTMEDATGEEITLEEPPERVTTTNPSAAQTMWEIGGKAQVVGVTDYAMYLDGAEERDVVSAEDFGVSVEKVVATEPDLVIAPNASSGDVEALREAGLKVYHLPEQTDIDDVRDKTTTIGQLTGNCEGAAETNAWMDANVEAVSEITADVEEEPRALYPLGSGYVVAGNTFIDAMFRVAGVDNVAAAEHDGYPQLSDEVVLELDPEVLIVQEGMEHIVDEEPYTATTAGETNSTAFVEVQWVNQPAPRSVVMTTHDLAAQFHSDVYTEDAYVERSEITVEAEGEASAEASADDGENETETQAATETPAATESPTETEDSAPGFGVGVALVAALAATLIATRRQ